MNKYQKLGTVLTLVLGSAGAANASVLFDNTASPIEGAIALGSTDWAESAFSCPAGCSIDSISLKIRLATGENPVNLGLSILNIPSQTVKGSLTENNGGVLLGNFAAGVSSFTPVSAINLSPGVNYWIRLTNQDPSTAKNVEWAYDSVGNFTAFDHTNPAGEQIFNVPNNLEMKIVGTSAASAIPIPATAWLMGTALFGLGKTWRKKQI
jgi:hypothetical protein